MVNRKIRVLAVIATVGLASIAGLIAISKSVSAADNTGDFSLQISPSPLVLTLKPGQATSVELKVRNTGSQTEDLKVSPRSFKIDDKESLVFDDVQTPEEAKWITFGSPTFTVAPGEVMTEKVTFAVPKDAGFSYSFALVINRQKNAPSTGSGRQLKGSVALFTLINIDRPGAVRKLDLSQFTSDQSIYEYLPVKFDVKFKNTGNTIIQPSGNVFIQRGSNDATPISTLPVNKANGYILPGVTRTLKSEWSDGFQVAHTVMAVDGTTKQELSWNWNNLSRIPIGRYTAKVVAIYNDGQRDVPIVGEVSFWVIPWKLLLGLLVVMVLVGAGLWTFIRSILHMKKKHMHFRS
ncbi:MAG: exported protein of unknown function [Candidatus Saccharibacteria bacterium]|nr:exported protein of unknown function [Candidatus Saccharibacteria bacterium]